MAVIFFLFRPLSFICSSFSLWFRTGTLEIICSHQFWFSLFRPKIWHRKSRLLPSKELLSLVCNYHSIMDIRCVFVCAFFFHSPILEIDEKPPVNKSRKPIPAPAPQPQAPAPQQPELTKSKTIVVPLVPRIAAQEEKGSFEKLSHLTPCISLSAMQHSCR